MSGFGSVLSSFFRAIGSYFVNVFKSVIGSQAAGSIQDAVKHFIVTEIGAIALDAVEWVAANMEGAESQAKRDAAKAKLVEDAKTAGHDLTTLGEAALNLFIELAVTALKAKLAA